MDVFYQLNGLSFVWQEEKAGCLEKLDGSYAIRLTETLQKRGLSDTAISDVIVESEKKRA